MAATRATSSSGQRVKFADFLDHFDDREALDSRGSAGRPSRSKKARLA
jgi:hypothetical protein